MADKPVIAIDLDDVLAPSAQQFVDYTNKKWGTNLTLEEYNEDLTVMWKLDHDKTLQEAHQMLSKGFVRTFPKYDEAKPVLDRLKRKYKLVITTSRIKLVHKDTMDWLEEHHPDTFSEIYMTGFYEEINKRSHVQDKGELYKSIGASYVIDDQPKHCRAAADQGLKAILYGNYPWNRDAKLPAGVSRAHDWQEVAEYFNV